jgi:small subunit ribosomal protein S16
MATSIRLTRLGRKQAPFYRLVVCDSRTRRDGSYIESLGYYNPMPDAYQLEVDHGRAIDWLVKGAQPTDTAKSLLRTEGVLYRWHLMKNGAEAGEVDAQVEEYRTRRANESEAIKSRSVETVKAAKQSREDAAKKKRDAKSAAVAESAEAAEAAKAAEAAEAAKAAEVASDEPAAEEEASAEPAEASTDEPIS